MSSPIRYDVNENPPTPLAFGLAIQFTILAIAGIVVTPAIVVQAAGGSLSYLEYAVFASLLVCGVCTFLQARPIWRIGSGYVLLMGTSGAFIAVSIAALKAGGPVMLGALVLVSSFVQFVLAFKLSWLRKVVTPAVGGVVIMLIPVTVLPIAFDFFATVPEGVEKPFAAPFVVLLTILVGVGLGILAKGMLRLWTPVIGIVVGTITAAFLGLYDFTAVRDAAWIGIPNFSKLSFDFSLNSSFFTLLPSFIFVTIIGMVETIGDSIAIQRVSNRNPKSPDYRVVQGAVGADGFGNLLSGCLAIVPNTTYSSSISVTELTGVASRRVGMFIGGIFVFAAFLPKLQALIVSLPPPVIGAYLLIVLGLLFVVGLQMVARSGLDYRTGLIVGISMWLGVGFQYKFIFPELFTGMWGELLQNGMTVGGLTAIFLMLLWQLTSSRRLKTQCDLTPTAIQELQSFLDQACHRWKVSDSIKRNIELANEETLHILQSSRPENEMRKLSLTVHKELGTIELEYVLALDLDNIEDRLTILQESPAEFNEDDYSLRILRHISAQVKHEKYFDMDFLSVKVEC